MEKERIDARTLEPAAREQLRKTAIRMHRRGQTHRSIAEALGVRRREPAAGLDEEARGRLGWQRSLALHDTLEIVAATMSSFATALRTVCVEVT